MYSQIPQGVVFELDAAKAEVLAAQRPSWSVYEANCITALRAGAGGHLECNVVDLDPYGEPWPIVEALFASERPWPARLAIAVNDGGRVKVQLTGAWEVKSLRPALEHFGIGFMYPQYLAVCRWNLERLARPKGYTMTDWTGYYCGKAGCMTHYGAILERETKAAIGETNRPIAATKPPRRATPAKISATKRRSHG